MKSLPFTEAIWQAKLKVLQGPGEAQTRRLEPGLKEINKHPDEWYRVTQWGGCENFVFGTDTRKLFQAGAFLFTHYPTCDSTHGIEVKPRHREGEIAYVPEAWCLGSYKRWRYAEVVFKSGSIRVAWNSWLEDNTTATIFGSSNVIEDKWRSPRFMPAWAARWFVQIVGPPVPQRVQEVTFEDCLAEGVVGSKHWLEMSRDDNYKPPEPLHPEDLSNEEIEREISRGWEAYTRQAYSRMWDAAYPRQPFQSNPWEMTYRFRLKPRPEGL